MIVINVSGNLTADAIVKNINGAEVINFTVASTDRYTTKEGEVKEDVTFLNCQLWGKSKAADYLFKGRPVTVVGLMKQRSYINNEGQLQKAFNVRVSSFQLFGKNRIKQLEASPMQETNTTAPTIEQPIDDLPF